MLAQSLTLGITQIVTSVLVNGMIIFAAGTIAAFLATRPGWQKMQRWLMGTVLAGLAVKMVVDKR